MTMLSKIEGLRQQMPMMFVRFYAVGLLLFAVPFTRDLFVSIISLTLLLVITAVLLFHRNWNLNTVLWFAFIVLSSFFLEMAGVQTGNIFGEYTYSRGLSPLVNGTPLIIGLNWLFLVYASHDIVSRVRSFNAITRTILGSLLMIAYDIVLEWIAPIMQMWHFQSGFAPMRNFMIWFLAALVFHGGFELLGIRSNNLPARSLFWVQMGFFVLLGIYAQLFII